jgi:hypothetical protein
MKSIFVNFTMVEKNCMRLKQKHLDAAYCKYVMTMAVLPVVKKKSQPEAIVAILA